jgi:hypothetical protein
MMASIDVQGRALDIELSFITAVSKGRYGAKGHRAPIECE